MAEDSVKDASEVEFEARQAKKIEKIKESQEKEAKKFDDKVKKIEYQRTIQQMDMETLYKIQKRKQQLKENKKKSPKSSITGIQ